MSLIYETNHWKGGPNSKQENWNEYRQDGSTVTKVKCSCWKTFDGDESYWEGDEEEVDSWEVGDDDMPDWLVDYLE